MKNRLENVIAEMKRAGLGQLLVSDPAAIDYLTGVCVEPEERFWALLVRHDGWHVLFANRLFAVPAVPYEVVRYDDTDDVIAILANHLDPSRPLGVDEPFRARFLIPLAEATGIRMVLAGSCVDRVRAVKDEAEIALMKEASRINDAVMGEALAYLKPGLSEKQVAEYIGQRYLAHGCSGLSFPTIVSFGGHAADPHHAPDDTVLQHPGVVLIDTGAVYHGYCSDMTRTFFYGQPGQQERAVYELVRQANEAAEAVIRPGVKLCDIDAAARGLIAQAGYGPQFNHRLGHFIGRQVHEKGDVSAANPDPVVPGMIFSCEPGVYLAGRFGVRIEDLVLVTQEGCAVLNRFPKELTVIPEQ